VSETDRPPWCRECDPRTRLVDLGNRTERCQACHPYWRIDGQLDINPGIAPVGREAQVNAVEWLRHRNLSLRSGSVTGVRDLARKFFNAGWTPNDLVYALGHLPDGAYPGEAPQPGTSSDRVILWMRQRLTPWLDEDRDPLQSLSQQRASRAAAMKSVQETRAQEHGARMAAVAAPHGASASSARAVVAKAAVAASARRRQAAAREQDALGAAVAQERARVGQYETALQQMADLTETQIAARRKDVPRPE
jgi:hypothetical protein